ncbi:MAG: phosphate--acyl-ACP acyltransferase, partial [Oscillospiraceae bacterium]|nr:phosphate--acyl-ACP acyltransferase [Oscillospiraceae bacterium]
VVEGKKVVSAKITCAFPILPTMKGGIVGLCDSGANVDIIPDQLREFAIMGSRYLETVFDIKNPRVAMLNVGTEREKGDDLRKTAYPLLENEPSINFVGNMESRDLLTGKYDLVVCDGFSGNVLTKTTEGTALEMLKMIKRDIQKSWKYKLGALLMKKMLMAEKNFMDYQNYGGSVLLGSEKVIVKGHGSSDASSVLKCIEQAYRMELSGLNDKIMESIKEEANV